MLNREREAGMDATFDRLEERVNAAVETIARLRREREELEAEIEGLRSRNGELEQELARTREATVDRGEFEVRKKAIEKRVEGLLSLFDSLEEGAAG
jgi:FtsZ-binding cell division protein ZapB